MKSEMRPISLTVPRTSVASVWVLTLCSLCLCGSFSPGQAAEVVVGSKAFTEGVILGELITQLARLGGTEAWHREQLGGTRVLWNALKSGDIDAYAEYTGTLSQEIFAGRGLKGEAVLREALAKEGIRMSRPLGFNNVYALGMKEEVVARLGIDKISDLRHHPGLRLGFTNEFLERGDGWPGLRDRYQLPQRNVSGLEHALAYRGLEGGSLDVIDLYSTDPEIQYYGLRVLQDDLRHFPQYHAVILYREKLREEAPAAVESILRLEGRVSQDAIIRMNARAKPRTGDRVPEKQVAADFLADHPYFRPEVEDGDIFQARAEGLAESLLRHTGEHLRLVAISLAAAIVIALPLGVLAARRPKIGQVILGAVGVVQTIPSLALLVFLVPFLHLGVWPAVVALFLYSLLPIVRNTYAGLHDIPPPLRESAEALGLPPAARLRLIELPLAARSILAGIKTAAVINVGTATLGGLIGAGGYGQPIMTGIRLDKTGIILQGAIPAALLALLVQGLFELTERALVSKGLRLRPAA